MAYGEPSRTAARRTRSTVLVAGLACLALLLAATAFAAASHLLNDKDSTYMSPDR
jgi:hypothetical protein